jgi:putative endonuclease
VSFPRRRESSILYEQYYVYILASKKNGTLYIGVTSDLVKRICEHKQKLIDGFTKEYNVHALIYYEQHNEIEEAILREKQMKKWNRKWKIRLIEENNPEWKDLRDEYFSTYISVFLDSRLRGNDSAIPIDFKTSGRTVACL